MPLTDEQVQQLLAGEIKKAATPRTGGGKGQPAKTSMLPRPQQFGPLVLVDKDGRCVSRNCSAPTNVKIRGVGYQCVSHALTSLNRIAIDFEKGEDFLAGCTCKAGEYSKGHVHTLGCALYVLDKETANEYL